uniref:Uncharacterized protein n=1 Tax=Knipowitschia caucasica TaxID=637954 RepID=A0AAV2LKS8_KNICA
MPHSLHPLSSASAAITYAAVPNPWPGFSPQCPFVSPRLTPPHPLLTPSRQSPASERLRLPRPRSFFHYEFICRHKKEATGAT